MENKYHYKDVVSFSVNNEMKQGIVYIIDKNGIFEDANNVYYDIYVKEDNCLYKHIVESNLNLIESFHE